MRSPSAQMRKWFVACIIGIGTLSSVWGMSSVKAGAAYPACVAGRPLSAPQTREVHYCLYRIVVGDTLGSIARQYRTTPDAILRANQEVHVSGQQKVTDGNRIWAGALLRIPTPVSASEAPAPPPAPAAPAQALPLSPALHIGHLLSALRDGQTALETALSKQERAIAALISGQEHHTRALTALRTGAGKRRSQTPVGMILALALSGAAALAMTGVLLFRVWGARPPQPVPAAALYGQAPALNAPIQEPQAKGPIGQVKIATRYLSTPKHEDVILTASRAWLYALVLADGASAYRVSGGEISGGGRHAAEIAAQSAITYLTDHILPSLRVQDIVTHLHACFSAANAALETHNQATPTPGATTLLIALLCQDGSGQWYWCYGNLGNGVLALLHAQSLLAGWPIHTPLLSKQVSGVTTLTMPGYAAQGYRPAVALRPHVPGDLLLMGSDGLDHLDAVTKTYDKLYLLNYVWKQIRHDRAQVETALQGLHHERADTQWQSALELDDTTIGILWA